MSSLSQINVASLAPPNIPPALRLGVGNEANGLQGLPAEGNDALREAFTQFVGESFYGQMIKAMRSTVGKPAYFDGGRAEEAFRGQLDQALSEHMTSATADRFADPMFRRQFPQQAETAANSGLKDLGQLMRR
jgi:Rod binding domain-containing protein